LPGKPVKRNVPLRERSPVLAHLRSIFVAGLLTAIPIFITVYIISFFYGLVTRFTTTPANWIVDHLMGSSNQGYMEYLRTATSATFAVLISLLIVYILGLLGSFFLGRQILAQFEHFIENLPLIKGIYATTKQVMSVFRQGGGGTAFQRVVLVEFPRQGTWTIAFVTNTVLDSRPMPPSPAGSSVGDAGAMPATAAAPRRLICCFIPMTPNPTSGFFQMFPEDQVRDTDWTVDLGIKIVLSGGLLAPHELHTSAHRAAMEATVMPKRNS
jgi:uncharacterized membrane protein